MPFPSPYYVLLTNLLAHFLHYLLEHSAIINLPRNCLKLLLRVLFLLFGFAQQYLNVYREQIKYSFGDPVSEWSRFKS